MSWYKIITKECHIGAGKYYDKTLFVWANDIIHALNKYKKVGGVPRNKVPSIIELNEKDASRLEKIITEEKRLCISKVKNSIIYYNENINL